MKISKHFSTLLAAVSLWFAAVPMSQAQFSRVNDTKKPAAKPAVPTPRPPHKPNPRPDDSAMVTCRMCGQRYDKYGFHICPNAKVTCPKCGLQYNRGGSHICLADIIPITCRNCGQTYWRGERHVCRPQPQQPTDRKVRCRSCGQTYWESRGHRCERGTPYTPPEEQYVEPNVPPPPVTPKPPKPPKPSVPQGGANHTKLKLTSIDEKKLAAIQKSIISPLLKEQLGNLQNAMPSSNQISNAVDKMSFKPPLTPADKAELMNAVQNGDAKAVNDVLDKYGTTGQDNSTLLGLAGLQKVVNDGKVNPAKLVNLLNTLANGDTALLGKPGKEVFALGLYSKINHLLDIAATVVNSLAGTNIPTGVVPLVTFPSLPYGMVFPLGNGVFGIGTGGQGSVGLYQGYIPSVPVYSGSNAFTPASPSAGQTFLSVLNNRTSAAMEYYFSNDNTERQTLDGNYWQSWSLGSRPSALKYREKGESHWKTLQSPVGAFEVTGSAGSISLNPVKTNLTFKSPGNPIPFKLYANGDKFVIEPGKSLTLTMPDNECIKIKFARSTELNDVAEYIVGGKMEFEVGTDNSTGKIGMFWAGAQKIEKPQPSQNTSAVSQEIAVNDTKLSAANAGGLPVLPDYD